MNKLCKAVSKMMLEEKDYSIYNNHINGCPVCKSEIARFKELTNLLKEPAQMREDLWPSIQKRVFGPEREAVGKPEISSRGPVLQWASAAVFACVAAFLIYSGVNTGRSDRDLIVNELLKESYDFIANETSSLESESASEAQIETAVDEELNLWEYNAFYDEKSS